MNCPEFQRFADAYVDGEFGDAEQAEISAHLAGCGPCRTLAGQLESIKQLVKSQQAQDQAPDHLRSAVATAIAGSAVGWSSNGRLYVGAATAAGLVLLFVSFFNDPDGQTFRTELVTDLILEASVDWHRANLPIEVTGPDTDNIRDWFIDKVDFPVRLPRFDDSISCSLLGGRLSHLNNNRAAHVLYEVEGARVSVLLFRDGGNLRVPVRPANAGDFQYYRGNLHGYNVALFADNGVNYTITTALPQRALNELVSHVDFEP